MTEREKPSAQFIVVGFGTGLVYAVVGSATAGHLPFGLSWLLETAISMSMFTGMTLWKANRWGWVWTSVAGAVCLAEAFAYVTRLSHVGGGLSFAAGGLIGLAWLIMLTLDRHCEAPPEPVTRVLHEHVFHGLPDGVQLPGMSVPGEVIQVPQPAVTVPRQPRAIGAVRMPGGLGQWLGDKVPVKVVRR